jgi:hypothetical protein
MIKKLLALVLMTLAIVPARVPPAAMAQDPFGTVDIVLEETGITNKSRMDTFWMKQDRILKSPQQN